ncbi:MAG: DUF3244 domain-containing protein [Clostridium sp.]|nr:DUF3244 domain-containing protein [Bacteroidales bacterium]MCM1510241.1 DUF3244 domain-containing protein [Clostridium sp.]
MATLLTRAEQMNSGYIPMDTVTFMDEVLGFYNSHGTAEERIRANYMKGCVLRDKGDSPTAMEYYMKAVALADTADRTCNFELLGRIYAQMAELFHKQRYPQKELEMWNNAISMAKKAQDTLMYAEHLAHSAEMYEFLGNKNKARKTIENAYSLYNNIGKKKYAAGLLAIMASYDLERGSIQSAKQKTDRYIGVLLLSGTINIPADGITSTQQDMDNVRIELHCSWIPPYSSQYPIRRSPAKRPVAYLSGETVSFPAFTGGCTLELVDASTEEVVYSQHIPASETSCTLPSDMKGEYILRFTFEQYTLEGYVEL